MCYRIYLLKQLHRRFGANCVVQLSQLKSTKWIVPEALRNEVSGSNSCTKLVLYFRAHMNFDIYWFAMLQQTEPSLPDFFIVSSDQYRTVRQFLELFITEGNVTELKTAFQVSNVCFYGRRTTCSSVVTLSDTL